MREDTEIRIPRDDERIDVTDLKEVDYWTQWFGVSEERRARPWPRPAR